MSKSKFLLFCGTFELGDANINRKRIMEEIEKLGL